MLAVCRLLGEERLGDRGGELEGAALGELGGPGSLSAGCFVNLTGVAGPGAHVTAEAKTEMVTQVGVHGALRSNQLLSLICLLSLCALGWGPVEVDSPVDLASPTSRLGCRVCTGGCAEPLPSPPYLAEQL